MTKRNNQKTNIGRYIMAALAIIIILAMILSSIRF
jgi:hypothetical protein